LFAIRYAIGLSAANKIFINKADICPAENIEVVTSYEINDKALEGFPLRLNEVTGVKTEKMAGWSEANYGVNDKEKATPELVTYLNYIKDKLSDLDVSIVSVGTGPDREHSFNWDK
jgi:adenylosuccinate synthase